MTEFRSARTVLRTIDLGPTELTQHHLISEGDFAVQHVTLHGLIGINGAAARRRAGHRSIGSLDVHPHLACRRRDARRALGLS